MLNTMTEDKAVVTAVDYYKKLTSTLARMDMSAVDQAVELIKQTWLSGRQIICFGNGGSALTAQHYITDWNKCIYMATGRPFKGRCLADNMGLVTAYGNDVSYQDIFVEQLKPVLEPGDLVVAISGSGNSENVLRAVRYANEKGNMTLGLCGYEGGKLKSLVKHAVWAPINDMQISEDVHFTIGHIVMQSLSG